MHVCTYYTYMMCARRCTDSQSKINSKIQKLKFFLCGNYLVVSTCIVSYRDTSFALLHGYCSKVLLYSEYSETPYLHH